MLPSRWSPFRVRNIEHPKPGNLCIYQLTDKISLPSITKRTFFYCQNEKNCGGWTERLVTCRNPNVRVSIQDIVDVSGNQRRKLNLAHIITDADFLSRDNKYHEHCHTANCLAAPELARLAEESERLVDIYY